MKRLVFIMLLMVAACSPQQPAATDLPPAVTEAPTQSLEGYEEQVGAFIVNVSGESNRDFSGAGIYTDLGEEGIILTLSTHDPNAPGSTVQIALPGGTQPGNYELVSYGEVFDEEGTVIKAGASYSEQIGGGEGAMVIYSNITSGNITLQTINPITGSFTFTADNDGVAVTVNGVMNQIPALDQG